MKKLVAILMLVSFVSALMGCGETISGAAKDVKRMNKGVRTFLFKDSE